MKSLNIIYHKNTFDGNKTDSSVGKLLLELTKVEIHVKSRKM